MSSTHVETSPVHPTPDALASADRRTVEAAYRLLYAESLDLRRVAVERLTGHVLTKS